jgi:hypothetical protein
MVFSQRCTLLSTVHERVAVHVGPAYNTPLPLKIMSLKVFLSTLSPRSIKQLVTHTSPLCPSDQRCLWIIQVSKVGQRNDSKLSHGT